ncbi:MAG: trypsin-like peptidase domain-containing protein [Ruminococcus sp.]|nr:trypsin-like peptidase domain-containing protein [Ruminococcus sp.]MBR2282969.1 trypsin-like peptidase domain-containing protein [Ruminococcus sp.]
MDRKEEHRDELFSMLAAGAVPSEAPEEPERGVIPENAPEDSDRAAGEDAPPESSAAPEQPVPENKAEPENKPAAAVPPLRRAPAAGRYDSFMYEPIGFDRYDRAAAEAEAEAAEKKERKLRLRRERRIAAAFIIACIAAAALSVYGIVSDIIAGSGSLRSSGGQVVLYQQSKPEGANELAAEKDENGRYSTEGVAAVVQSSIVEIYTYTDRNRTELVGTGSGVVISDDGYIVTNAHVLQSSGYHSVHTLDGDIFPARVIGRDSKTDIAVIKISPGQLEPAVLGDSDEVMVGEQVVAVGNPAGLSGTVTDGIVSAVHRKIRSDSTGFQMDCIQTNAAISPGNSGGALVNMYGQVVGITSSKYVSSSYEGLGFAITINEARPIIEQLIENGYVPGRFRVGVAFIESGVPLKRDIIESELGFSLPEGFEGLYVTQISDECDISNTELKLGDFIISVDGVTTSTYDELNDTVTGSYGPGDKVTFVCTHLNEDGTQEDYEITFMLMPDTSGDY